MAKKEEDPRRPTPVARDGAYVMMLFATFVAIVGGCVLLYLDHEDYGSKSPPKEPAPKVQDYGTAAKLEAPAAAPAAPAPGPGPAEPMPPP